MAHNFPVNERVRSGIYLSGLDELNAEIGLCGMDYENLLIRAESELYKLKGKSVVSNPVFNVVILYPE